MSLVGLTPVMALRNLLRHRRRTISTLLAIAAGLFGLILLDGFICYSMNGFRDSIVRSGTGHIQVATSPASFDEGDGNPLPFLFGEPARLEAELRSVPGVREVMPALTFAASASSGGKSVFAQVSSYPIDQARKNLSARTIVEGQDLEAGRAGLVLLGSGLARELGARPGATISLFALCVGGGVNTESFTVSGISSSGIKELDDRAIAMSLDDAQALIGARSASRLVIFLKSADETARVVRRIGNLPPGSTISGMALRDWEELSPSFRQANALYMMILAVARAVVLIVALVSISGTLSLTVMERYREIGTLRAFGTKRPGLLAMLACEGFFLGLAGTVAGTLAGAAASGFVNVLGGIEMAAEPGMSIASLTIFFTPKVENLVVNGLALLFASVLAALLPGMRSQRLTIAEQLRSI